MAIAKSLEMVGLPAGEGAVCGGDVSIGIELFVGPGRAVVVSGTKITVGDTEAEDGVFRLGVAIPVAAANALGGSYLLSAAPYRMEIAWTYEDPIRAIDWVLSKLLQADHAALGPILKGSKRGRKPAEC